MNSKIIALVAGLSAFGLSACTNPDGSPNTTATGATIGALGGAAAGNLLGGDSRSTLIGGVLGAGTGAAVGAQQQRSRQQQQQVQTGYGTCRRSDGTYYYC